MLDSTYTNYFPIDNSFLLWVTVKSETGIIWYIVSDLYRKEYFLFKDKKQTRYKSENPSELYKYIK